MMEMYKIIFCKLCWLTKILNPTGYKLTPTYDAIWAMFILVWLQIVSICLLIRLICSIGIAECIIISIIITLFVYFSLRKKLTYLMKTNRIIYNKKYMTSIFGIFVTSMFVIISIMLPIISIIAIQFLN